MNGVRWTGIPPADWLSRDLGSRLRALRMVRDLSPTVVPQAAGCSQAFLVLIELGRARPAPALLERISVVLYADTGELRRLAGYDRSPQDVTDEEGSE